MVILLPVMLVIVAGVGQIIAWQFGQQAAQASAALGAEAARLHGATDGDGARAAFDSAARFPSLHGVTVAVSHPKPRTAQVEVSASIPTLIPGVDLAIHGSATVPMEPSS